MNKIYDELNHITLDGRYKIEEKIGTGGMATVYKGMDLLLERPVAIKILHANFANDRAFVTRFKGEAQAAGKLNHSHIVNMYDVGFDQGYHYIIMEYVQGKTLRELIQEKGKLPVDMSVSIAIAIAEGLEQAHAMGIVHCDIKPPNIIITKNNTVKVTDFGIARAINSSQTLMYTTSVMGSAHYLSPEQASGKPIDGSSDIYSLGVVLYEMLTGRVPYEGDSPISVAIKHVQEKLVPPSRFNPNIPPLLESAVLKSLEKETFKRYQNISEMIGDLRLSLGFAGGKPSRIPTHDFATQIMPPVKDKNINPLSKEHTAREEESSWMDAILQIPQKFLAWSAIILFFVAFIWAYFSFGNFWSNTTIIVPNVVGKQASVAKNILADNHLRSSVSEVANSDIPEGQVISMSPEAGSEVKEQRIIKIVVSKGAGEVSLPDLKGIRIDDAKTTLSSLGIKIANIETKEDNTQPDNVIISQKPAAFTKVNRGSTISLTVNKRKIETYTLPNVSGLSLEEAKKALEGLRVTVKVEGDESEKSIVKESIPGFGTAITEGQTLTLITVPEPSAAVNKVSGSIDITVPEGPSSQNIRIIVSDDNGKRVIYDHNQKPGDHISRTITGIGSVRVLVYINGNLVQDQIL